MLPSEDTRGFHDGASFTAVVTSHQSVDRLRRILGNLRYQSRPPDETLALFSDIEHHELARAAEDFPEVTFIRQENLNDWGHSKRANGVRIAEKDYLGFFNDDDSYNTRYIELMLGAAREHGADVVYCGWSSYPDCEFRLGSSTSGNFIVRTSLARKIGYPGDRVYENDGHFIDALAALADPIVYLPQNLYTHNA